MKNMLDGQFEDSKGKSRSKSPDFTKETVIRKNSAKPEFIENNPVNPYEN